MRINGQEASGRQRAPVDIIHCLERRIGNLAGWLVMVHLGSFWLILATFAV